MATPIGCGVRRSHSLLSLHVFTGSACTQSVIDGHEVSPDEDARGVLFDDALGSIAVLAAPLFLRGRYHRQFKRIRSATSVRRPDEHALRYSIAETSNVTTAGNSAQCELRIAYLIAMLLDASRWNADSKKEAVAFAQTRAAGPSGQSGR